MPLRAMQAVYCYAFPEVQQLLHEVERAVPDAIYRITTSAAEAEQLLAPLFSPPLRIPATRDGHVDLDTLHEPIIERIFAAYGDHVKGLEGFANRYPTSGSSEGLFHLLAQLRTDGARRIHVLEGEYEGYGIQGNNLGLETVVVKAEGLEPKALEPGVWFLSNPSARDGNILPAGLLRDLCEAGHRLILDLAYVGATEPHLFDVSHPNVTAVVLSFSKPYGVFRSRIGGLTLSRTPLPTLYGNKWFKDILRLLQGLKLAETVGPPTLNERHRPMQRRVLALIEAEHGLALTPSDSFLLAHLTAVEAAGLDEVRRQLVAPYARGPGFRFCLTPYFEELGAQGG